MISTPSTPSASSTSCRSWPTPTRSPSADEFSYLLGDHDLKFGVDYTDDNMKQLFAGSLDGRYDFCTMDGFSQQ